MKQYLMNNKLDLEEEQEEKKRSSILLKIKSYNKLNYVIYYI